MKCICCGQSLKITGVNISSVYLKCELCERETEFIGFEDERHPEYKKWKAEGN